MQDFFKEYVDMFKRWNDFEGKSTRREFWMAVLVNFVISFVLGLILPFIGYLYGLVVLIPGLAVAIRRMHDIGKSGWNLLWSLLPIIGTIYVIYLLAKEK